MYVKMMLYNVRRYNIYLEHAKRMLFDIQNKVYKIISVSFEILFTNTYRMFNFTSILTTLEKDTKRTYVVDWDT